MLLQLKVNHLKVNLPLQDCEIIFYLGDKNRQNSLPNELNCEPKDEYVLMTELSQISVQDTEFGIQVQNPENSWKLNLNVLAVSNSNSKVLLLGFTEVDVQKFIDRSFQNLGHQIRSQDLVGVSSQKGSVTFEINTNFSNFQDSTLNEKNNESLDKAETSSSDSYDANLKQLQKSSDSQKNYHSARNCLNLFGNQINAEHSSNIILEEIDLQDSQDDYPNDQDKQETPFPTDQTLHKKMTNLLPQINSKQNSKINNTNNRLLKEMFQIQRHLHRLQESDFFLISLEEKLNRFRQ